MLTLDARLNAISERVIGAAIEVHRATGPGLLESAYQHCLEFELTRGGISFARQRVMPVVYKGAQLDCGYRLDFLVEDQVIVEVKAVSALAPIHVAQMITYLKLSKRSLGLLMNFNVPRLRAGIRRVVVDAHDQT